ncbi:acyltransferase [Flavobacterium sp.]|uniref:acyltransferase n=1 Tax=Flavobacterium sp. TaxID=239 RepID=UPI00262E4A13|nr:acyltransferase [Flavobacterium sp.]
MSQLRKHLKFTWRNKWRYFRASQKLAFLGKNVHIDKSVEFMRFPHNISIGDDVVIKEGARICSCNQSAMIKIGNRTTIGYHNFIFSSENIEIGADCLIAPFVYIVDSNHSAARDLLINQQPNVTAPIQIGNGVWIASNVTILKGVTIGDGAVIAANSVVNKDVPPFEIWAGTPAKKISTRE